MTAVIRPARIISLVVGCVMLLPGVGLLVGGGALGVAYASGRNDSGYFQAALNDVHSPTAAITAETPALTDDLQPSTWLIHALDTDLRLQVTVPSNSQVFVGIGPAADVDAYLGGIAHEEITGLANGSAVFRSHAGTEAVAPPTEQTFWATTAIGSGTQQLSWKPTGGQWAVVIMNADGSPGIAAAATVEIRAGFLLPLALILLVLGILITAGAVTLVVNGATNRRNKRDKIWPSQTAAPDSIATATLDHPIALTAQLDPGLSRWYWLVKWFLAIPHYVVLAFLWPAFLVVTTIAGLCILFTGRYPRPLFDFTTGVLRWSWRVAYFAGAGGIGTDRYPPFTLGSAPDYPATLDIAYPERLSRGLVLVKWWLLAIPHYLIIGLLISNWWRWTSTAGERFGFGPVGSGGLFGLLIVITGVVLLITGKYPPQLFALIIGCNRWLYRVIAYAALITDDYPPFRLDEGGTEPLTPPTPPTIGPASAPTPTPAGSKA
ncbi:MAG: DUF4389 domain-containing protein [Nakamurella sp.]